MRDCLALSITEASQVGEARRIAVAMTQELEFGEADRAKVAIVATEAANNLLKHAKQGELILRVLNDNGENGLELIALDRGPGMANVKQCLGDGYSTTGTPGTGLGAIQRFSTSFDIYSQPERGTVLLSRLWADKDERSAIASGLEIGVVRLPKPGEEVSGDAWSVEEQDDRSLVLVADGLGSGVLAAEASQQAIKILKNNARLDPKAILELMHPALRSTRGAAVAIAKIDPTEQTLRFAGIGNITGTIVTTGNRNSLVSYNGIVGHQIRKIQEFIYPWTDRSLLIMHSDGIGTQWSLEQYPGLANRHPGTIAGVLYRDFKRDRDDVTVLVIGH